MANLYGGGYQDDLVRGPRRKALLDDMPDRPDGPSPTGGGGLPASPTPTQPATLPPSPTLTPAKPPTTPWQNPGTNSGVPGTVGGSWQEWVRQAYQQTRQRDPTPEELAPWEGYWNDWGSKDPEYFKDRLFNPQKYGGGADGRSGLNLNFQTPNINDPVVNAQREAILQLLQHGNEPIDVASDPILSAQQGQYTQARRTGALQDRGAMAERAAAEGLNSGGQGSGAFDSGVQSINEGASRDIAGHQSELAMNELGARRQQFAQALQLADAIGARKESAQLQMKLAEIDAQLRKYGLDQQQDQFQDSMGFSWAKYLQDQNRDALLAGLGN
jgi:hypothetical protein